MKKKTLARKHNFHGKAKGWNFDAPFAEEYGGKAKAPGNKMDKMPKPKCTNKQLG